MCARYRFILHVLLSDLHINLLRIKHVDITLCLANSEDTSMCFKISDIINIID